MKSLIPVFLFTLGLASIATAQNIAINPTGAAPNASSMLDVASTTSGLLVPRMTLAQRNLIANPATSLLIFQTNSTPGYYYNAGTPAVPNWVRLYAGDGWSTLGNVGTAAGTNFLGTTDNIALRFRTNDIQRFEISTGTAATGGHLRAFNNGTAAAPTYSFNSNTGTGMFRPGTNILGLSTAGTERMRITAAGFFGIRNNTPAFMLHMTNGGVNVGAAGMATFENSGTDGVAAFALNGTTTNAYNAFEGGTEYNGAFGVSGVFGLHLYGGPINSYGIGVRGQSNDWQGNGVEGGRVNNGGANLGFGGLFIADLGYTGGLLNVSDSQLKTNITAVENALGLLNSVNIVSFYFKTNDYPYLGLGNTREFGVIAQELENVLPDFVETKALKVNMYQHRGAHESNENVEIEHFKMVDYTKFIPLLIKGIQEQQETIEEYEQIINELIERIEVIESGLITE